jgi:hypothetical protein
MFPLLGQQHLKAGLLEVGVRSECLESYATGIQALLAATQLPTLAHCRSRRTAETGTAVPSFWANSETRYSSSIQR